MYEALHGLVPDLHLISISMNQRKPKPDLPWLANCPNALELSVYPCKPHPGEYLLFLGRMSQTRAATARSQSRWRLELPLKIAGKKQEPKEERYFAEFVEPHLGMHDRVPRRGLPRDEGRAAPGCSARRSSRSNGRSRSAS